MCDSTVYSILGESPYEIRQSCQPILFAVSARRQHSLKLKYAKPGASEDG